MVITCKELAEIMGIDYLQASCVIKMLIKLGVASESEKIKRGGRGRPTIKYSIPEVIKINFVTGEVKEIEDA